MPDGVWVTLGDNTFGLLTDGALHRSSRDGYRDPVPVAEFQQLAVVTSALSVMAVKHGYPDEVHPTAGPSARAPDVSRTSSFDDAPAGQLAASVEQAE